MMQALALSLALQGKIEGVVARDGGAPVAGARVILGELGRATLFYNTPEEMFVGTPGLSEIETKQYSAVISSDSSGHFAVEGLAPGEYSIIAADAARGVVCSTAHLEAGAPLSLRLVLGPPAFVQCSIAGLAFDPTANVLELKPDAIAANITMVPRLAQQEGSWSFRSAPLPAIHEWRLIGTQVVLENDYRATLFDVAVTAEPGKETALHLEFDRGATVAGRVVDSGGAAVRNVSVVAVSESEPRREIGAVTDAAGGYRIRGLDNGGWRLEAIRYGVREVPGCGNGPQELFGSSGLQITDLAPKQLDLRVSASRVPPKLGELAPDFTATALDGRELKLSELRGKIVLLDFWATWCGMCRADFPRLQASYESLAPSSRFEIVGISIDEDVGLVRRFISSRGMRWPQTALGIAAKNPLAQLYNVNSTPSTVLIGADGKVIAINLTGEPLRAKLAELVGSK
jgi:peroxiredoxin